MKILNADVSEQTAGSLLQHKVVYKRDAVHSDGDSGNPLIFHNGLYFRLAFGEALR